MDNPQKLTRRHVLVKKIGQNHDCQDNWQAKNPESIFRDDPDLDSKSTGNFDS